MASFALLQPHYATTIDLKDWIQWILDTAAQYFYFYSEETERLAVPVLKTREKRSAARLATVTRRQRVRYRRYLWNDPLRVSRI